MSSDSDSSISSPDRKRHKKSSKKHKRKSEKKHKKHKKEKRQKEKKRTKRETSSSDSESEVRVKIFQTTSQVGVANAVENSFRILQNDNDFEPTKGSVEDMYGPALPPSKPLLDLVGPKLPTTGTLESSEIVDKIGPALPPDFQKKENTSKNEQESNKVIGPTLPKEFSQKVELCNYSTLPDTSDEDITDTYGPVPTNNVEMSTAQLELEERALKLKLAAIEGGSLKTVDQAEREEWMLELPEIGLKGGLAALSNMKRTFHQGKEKPDFSDRSAWTKTPQSESNPQKSTTSKSAVEDMKQDAQAAYDRKRDEEQERVAKQHKKKHKREESLVEIHQKKLRKEQKEKEKQLAAAGVKPERRPFSRDVDLKLNKIDSNQTKQIVDKAKILNTKFSAGRTKYL